MKVDIKYNGPILAILHWFHKKSMLAVNVGNSISESEHCLFVHYVINDISPEDALLFKMTFPECDVFCFTPSESKEVEFDK